MRGTSVGQDAGVLPGGWLPPPPPPMPPPISANAELARAIPLMSMRDFKPLRFIVLTLQWSLMGASESEELRRYGSESYSAGLGSVQNVRNFMRTRTSSSKSR